jgi:Cysteine-rich secretory protein family
MSTSRRILTIVAAVTIAVAGLAVPAQAGAESTLLARINASRASAGKAPLEVYWDLSDDARAHTARMLADGKVYHNPALTSVTSGWEALGENVGIGTDPDQLHEAFMASSGHRANILGDYNYVGIGTAVDADGLVWATVIFMRAAPGLNGGGTTTTSEPETTTTAPAPVPAEVAPPAASPAAQPVATAAHRPRSASPARSTSPVERPLVTSFGHPDGLPAFAI